MKSQGCEVASMLTPLAVLSPLLLIPASQPMIRLMPMANVAWPGLYYNSCSAHLRVAHLQLSAQRTGNLECLGAIRPSTLASSESGLIVCSKNTKYVFTANEDHVSYRPAYPPAWYGVPKASLAHQELSFNRSRGFKQCERHALQR
ncbi:hypothetical protein AXG93_2374s1140 [Marchantia polymorpha subsp. ruderalis]|uniref:Uncharacterized protein n=1 Tax=Marchantia polymorpha subsp. ruderalis TaxID=1480154 RepID=A0A176WH54_MARPO|nr:hypothetical protein AXG93_2374s1140 [Marchantia polymorpha subsp. ruderalis]